MAATDIPMSNTITMVADSEQGVKCDLPKMLKDSRALRLERPQPERYSFMQAPAPILPTTMPSTCSTLSAFSSLHAPWDWLETAGQPPRFS
jgi:hypothetical protein